jgi:hypothetical protein
MSIRPCPNGKQFLNLKDACKYGCGYTSSSLVHYVAGNINHVTPGAFNDYIYGADWPQLYLNVKDLIEKNGIDKSISLLYFEKYS